MPLLATEVVPVPFWQFNGHLQTIFPNINRKVEGICYERERICTWDEDFLDLDWSRVGSDSLVIISHGLAGSSNAPYVRGMIKIVNDNGMDGLAWNYRGCSGEPNKKLESFHGGKSDDLDWVIRYAADLDVYKAIYLVGISMGGNITLKLLGEWGREVPYPVKKAVAVSVPVDMYDASHNLVKGWNRIYSDRYLKQYIAMLQMKEEVHRDAMDFKYIYSSENLHVFVERFTAPSFGFRDAEEYLRTQSALNYLKNIRVPALLINADNDPFLTEKSFPEEEARSSEYFYLLKTKNGGHVGFADKNAGTYSWLEKRTIDFLKAS